MAKTKVDTGTEWVPFAKGDHYRGQNPQCSKPGCVERPKWTRYSTRLRLGRQKLLRHSFCADHAREEKAKERQKAKAA